MSRPLPRADDEADVRGEVRGQAPPRCRPIHTAPVPLSRNEIRIMARAVCPARHRRPWRQDIAGAPLDVPGYCVAQAVCDPTLVRPA
ncbi:hypothetical protein BZL30_5041 [Mycobacterium kansasii]|uniref:Uncharacterized protein n=1 Tax=Mycobacterium kansasii TaxID=1768 RepID=A0A1V3X396_MYCKA|nr:hypothetical protein BZL30_5041 [Mycobacterium kansasii]